MPSVHVFGIFSIEIIIALPVLTWLWLFYDCKSNKILTVFVIYFINNRKTKN